MHKLSNQIASLIYIVLICSLTAVLQALDFSSFQAHIRYITAAMAVIVYILVLLFFSRRGKLKSQAASLIIFGSMLIHSWYVLNTGIYDRQHDIGNITALNDGITNGGHIGYIEYFVKNHHMPDFAPFDVFAFYHPPLHHILAAVTVLINLASGVDYTLAFENVQALTLLYFGLMCVVVYSTLCKLATVSAHTSKTDSHEPSDTDISLIALSLICFHPSLIYMSGYLNNDMLTLLVISVILYCDISFILENNMKNLILIALSLGIGALCKLNACIYALPTALIFLLHFISEVKEGSGIKWLKRYVVFGLICIPIGMSFVIRNLIRFHEKPGILSANSDSHQYMGSYSLLTRLGPPSTLDLEYPFHSEYAKASQNVWLINLKTSLFGEIRPDLTSRPALWLSDLILILGLICGISCVIFMIISYVRAFYVNRNLSVFFLSGLAVVILSFIAFVLKYPYTCSCDFRYVASTLIYTGYALQYPANRHPLLASMLAVLLITSNMFLFLFCLN